MTDEKLAAKFVKSCCLSRKNLLQGMKRQKKD
jgi:hypothetical protein